MFKVSSKSPNYCCGFERDRYYTFEDIQRMLPSCYEIPDGVDEPIWKENSGNDIGDEHIFEWREL